MKLQAMKEWMNKASTNERMKLKANSVAVHTNAVLDTTCLPCLKEWMNEAISKEEKKERTKQRRKEATRSEIYPDCQQRSCRGYPAFVDPRSHGAKSVKLILTSSSVAAARTVLLGFTIWREERMTLQAMKRRKNEAWSKTPKPFQFESIFEI